MTKAAERAPSAEEVGYAVRGHERVVDHARTEKTRKHHFADQAGYAAQENRAAHHTRRPHNAGMRLVRESIFRGGGSVPRRSGFRNAGHSGLVQGAVQQVQEQADIGDDADCLAGPAIGNLRDNSRIDINANQLDP